MRSGVTWLSDDLIRHGAHNRALGSDGFVVVAYLLSRVTASPNKRAWETSAKQITEQFGWGGNRERATNALAAAVTDRRLVMRPIKRDGVTVANKCEYVVCSGGRRFAEDEWAQWSAPIMLAPNVHGKRAT